MKNMCYFICGLAVLALFLAGCSAGGEETGSQFDSANAEDRDATPDNILAKYRYSDFSLGEDYQSCFYDGFPITASEEGYYYVTSRGYLCFVDRKTDANIFVCSKVNCTHSTQECSAYLKGVKRELKIWFYKGSVYYISYDGGNSYNLYRISKDGSSAEKITEIFKFASGDVDSSVDCALHRGILFYSIKNEDGSCTLYGRRLQSPDKEIAFYTEAGDGSGIHRIRGYGDGICFEAGHRTGDTYVGNLYYYSMEQETVSIVYNNVYKDYAIADGVLIFSDDTKVWMVDLLNNERKEFLDDGYSYYISYDGKYVYLDNAREVMLGKAAMEERCVKVFDLQGTYVDQIVFESMEPSVFGDKDRFFYIAAIDAGENMYYESLMMMDKACIKNGNKAAKELLWE